MDSVPVNQDARGVGPSGVSRVFFDLAGEAARAECRPEVDWHGFMDALWEQLDAGFGLSAADDALPSVSASSRRLPQ